MTLITDGKIICDSSSSWSCTVCPSVLYLTLLFPWSACNAQPCSWLLLSSLHWDVLVTLWWELYPHDCTSIINLFPLCNLAFSRYNTRISSKEVVISAVINGYVLLENIPPKYYRFDLVWWDTPWPHYLCYLRGRRDRYPKEGQWTRKP